MGGEPVLTVDGIEVHVTREDLDDYEIAEALPRLVLKSDWRRVKGELRERNGGKLPNSAVFAFVRSVLAAVSAKN